MTQATHLAQSTGTSYTLTRATGTNYTLAQTTPTYANYLDGLLAESVWWIDAHQATASETIPNLGTGGTALNALNGGGTAITTNDAKWLEYAPADGAYAYLPGVALNYLSVPDPGSMTGDLTMLFRVQLHSYASGAEQVLGGQWAGAGVYAVYAAIDATGKFTLQRSSDGTDQYPTNYYESAVTGLTSGTSYWLKVTLDIDNGAGSSSASFYYAADSATIPSSWTTITANVTSANTTATYDATSTFNIGVRATAGGPAAGKFYRAIVYSDITGTTKVLDVDTSVLTDGSATSFTATTGQTVTINRSTSGRKATVVHGGAGGGSLWLFGTDDYLEVTDNALLDFGASDSFTVLAVVRQWATPTNSGALLSKSRFDSAPYDGWDMRNNGTTLETLTAINDGAVGQNTPSPTGTSGAAAARLAVVDRGAQLLTTYLNGTGGTSVSTASVGSLANAYSLRVGAAADATPGRFNDMEFVAALIWRRALTAAEITAVSNYFTTRTHAE